MNQSVNLLNALPKKVVIKLPAKLIFKCWVGFLVLLLLAYGLGYWQKSRVSNKLAQAKKAERVLSKQLIQLAQKLPNASSLKSKEDVALHLAKEIESKAQLVAILKRKANINLLGFSAYLEALGKAIPSTVWLTNISFSRGGEAILLKGKATNANGVFNFMSQLDEDSVYQSKTLKLISLETLKQGAASSEIENADKKSLPPVEFKLGTEDA